MAILVDNGRAAVATAIKNQPIYLAWGNGDPSWDSLNDTQRPVEPISATDLTKEIGRRLVQSSQYVVRNDTNGKIIVSTGKFDPSPNNTPTRYLYLNFQFDYPDGGTEDIRELGVFVGGKIAPTLSENNGYIHKSEVLDIGQLLVLEYIDKLHRLSTIKQTFEFVIQF